MIKRVFFIATIILFLSIVYGCWSNVELNQLAFISAMGIDKTDKGYKITVQIINPSEIAGEGITSRPEIIVYNSDSETLCDAFRRLTYSLPRRAYLSHILVIVLSEEVAKDGIAPVIDALARDDQLRPDTNVFIAKDLKAGQMLQVMSSLEKIPANKINNLIMNAETNFSSVHSITLVDTIKALVSEGKELILPGLTIEGNVENGNKKSNVEKIKADARIQLSNFSVFNNDRLIGWLDDETSKWFNHALGEIKTSMIQLFLKDQEYITLEVRKAKSKIDVKFKQDKPYFYIEHSIVRGVLCEVNCNVNATDPKEIKKYEKLFEIEIKERIDKSISKLQHEYQSDILGFGEIVHIKNPKLWNKISKDWNQIFQEIEIDVNVTVSIERPGNIINPIIKSLE